LPPIHYYGQPAKKGLAVQGTPKSTTPTAALSHCSHRWAEKTTYSMVGGSPTGWAQRVEIGRHRGYGPEFTGESGRV